MQTAWCWKPTPQSRPIGECDFRLIICIPTNSAKETIQLARLAPPTEARNMMTSGRSALRMSIGRAVERSGISNWDGRTESTALVRGRGVESGRKASAGTDRQQHSAIRRITLKYQSHQVRDTRRHLHAWAFTAEGKPGADRQQSAKESHNNQPKWRWRQFLVQDRLNLRDTTSPRRAAKIGEPTKAPAQLQRHKSRQQAQSQQVVGHAPLQSAHHAIGRLLECESKDRPD